MVVTINHRRVGKGKSGGIKSRLFLEIGLCF